MPNDTLREAKGQPKLGFTVIELVIGVAIAAILTVVAAPALQTFTNEASLNSKSGQLVSDLNFARLEAIKRNARVLVCAKSAAANTCSTTTNWQNGWLVCYDANSDDVCDATSTTDPNPMKIVGALNTSLQLTNTSTLIRFNPVATANSAAVLTLKGTWASSTMRTASVAATGYITIAKR